MTKILFGLCTIGTVYFANKIRNIIIKNTTLNEYLRFHYKNIKDPISFKHELLEHPKIDLNPFIISYECSNMSLIKLYKKKTEYPNTIWSLFKKQFQ